MNDMLKVVGLLTVIAPAHAVLAALDAQQLVSPSKALHEIAAGRLKNPRQTPAQVEAALAPLLSRVQKSNLQAEEEVALGLAYFFVFDGASAKPLLEKHRGRDDLLGRVSWQALQQMAFFGAKDYALVESRLKQFRATFAPVEDDVEYTFNMVNNLARRQAASGRHAEAVALILEDVQSLPLAGPFRSFDLLGLHYPSFVAAGKGALALDWMKRHWDALRETGIPAAAAPPSGRPMRELEAPHRDGVLHLFPFSDFLLPDDPQWSANGANRVRVGFALEKFERWIAAAERNEPIPPR